MEIDESNFCHYRKSSAGTRRAGRDLLLQIPALLLRKASPRRISFLVAVRLVPVPKYLKAGNRKATVSCGIGTVSNNSFHRTYAKFAHACELNR
ncbi:MAG: hypothetical protein JWM78_3138 [Verrucomicrobiaceae bacterium]|nr:hypothetical protein [Verrucomicrobiaceae bacterium]